MFVLFFYDDIISILSYLPDKTIQWATANSAHTGQARTIHPACSQRLRT